MYLIPSIFKSVLDGKDIYIMSIGATISGVVLIFPRSILNDKLQKLSKDAREKTIDIDYYNKIKKSLNYICLVLIPISMIVTVFYLFFNNINPLNYPIMSFNVALMMLIIIVGQLSIVESTLLVFLNGENKIIGFNTLIFVFVLIFYFCISFISIYFSPEYLVSVFLFGVLLLYVIRNFYLKNTIRGYRNVLA